MAAKKVVTPVFRVSFPSVFEASSWEGSAPKFEVTGLFDPSKFSEKDKERWRAMQALADEVSMDKFKKKVKDLPGNCKKPFRDGAEKEDLEGFEEGKPFARMSSKLRPGLIDVDRTPITDESEFYPGCYARATVTAYAYDNVGKGVAFGLQNLQKVADGERLDSRTDAAEDFEDDIDDEWISDDKVDENDPLA
jgi:hypothetical protein